MLERWHCISSHLGWAIAPLLPILKCCSEYQPSGCAKTLSGALCGALQSVMRTLFFLLSFSPPLSFSSFYVIRSEGFSIQVLLLPGCFQCSCDVWDFIYIYIKKIMYSQNTFQIQLLKMESRTPNLGRGKGHFTNT